jgi:hypothetical protein
MEARIVAARNANGTAEILLQFERASVLARVIRVRYTPELRYQLLQIVSEICKGERPDLP